MFEGEQGARYREEQEVIARWRAREAIYIERGELGIIARRKELGASL